ncbi:MAG: hypothetical protein ACM37U_12635, partial [Gemmatimonas sp.]
MARERRKHLILRSSKVAVVATTLGAAGLLSALAIRARVEGSRTEERVVGTPPRSPEVTVTGTPVLSAQVPAPLPAPAIQHAATVARSKPPLAPVVPQGESSLPDGPTAVRTDSLVTVSFDSPMIRT